MVLEKHYHFDGKYFYWFFMGIYKGCSWVFNNIYIYINGVLLGFIRAIYDGDVGKAPSLLDGKKKEKMSRKRWEIGRGRCRSALTRGAWRRCWRRPACVARCRWWSCCWMPRCTAMGPPIAGWLISWKILFNNRDKNYRGTPHDLGNLPIIISLSLWTTI